MNASSRERMNCVPLRRSKRLSARLNDHTGKQNFSNQTQSVSEQTEHSSPNALSQKRCLEDRPSQDNFNKRRRRSGRYIDTNLGESEPFLDPLLAIDHWRRTSRWPRELFEMPAMLARRRSSRRRSETGTSTTAPPEDHKRREEKSVPYRDIAYQTKLEMKLSFIKESKEGARKESKDRAQSLFAEPQAPPRESLFRDDIFSKTCAAIQGRNEAKVIQDIARLLVPSAEHLALDREELEYLVESVNQAWTNAIPFHGPRPQPDYAVGFRRSAFTKQQLLKMQPYIGDVSTDMSCFMGTKDMYFPFLSVEIKCGTGSLEIADRQNAHSATISVRAIVELSRLCKREQDIHRKILAFSVSHNHQFIGVYGHYPIIDGDETKFYRDCLASFSFVEAEKKWTALRFTKNVYIGWAPDHLNNIRSMIDSLSVHKPATEITATPTIPTSLSQPFDDQNLEVTKPRAPKTLKDKQANTSISRQKSSKRIAPNPSKRQKKSRRQDE